MPASPCTGRCQLQQDRCQGCGRTIQEIAAWRDMTEQQQQQVLDRLALEVSLS